jgi:hypothetical protein
MGHGTHRYVDTCHHYAKELAQAGIIKVTRIPGTEQLADFLTKPLPRAGFEKACLKLMP